MELSGDADKVLLLVNPAAELLQIFSILKIGKFIRLPELWDHLGVALDLHHLDEGLHGCASFSIGTVDWVTAQCDFSKKEAFTLVRIVWHGEKLASLGALLRHPLPQFLRIITVDRRKGHLGYVRITEQDVTVLV